MRFPHGRTTIIIETGKVKGKKERHPRGFFLMLPHAYVTGTVPDEGCVVWGNAGERESERQRRWPSCAAESNSSATVWAFVFVGMYVCVRLGLCNSMCEFAPRVCLYAYVEENVRKCVFTLCSSLYTVCMYPPLEYTNTHCLLIWDLGQNGASYCFLVFTVQNNFSYSASPLSLPFPPETSLT